MRSHFFFSLYSYRSTDRLSDWVVCVLWVMFFCVLKLIRSTANRRPSLLLLRRLLLLPLCTYFTNTNDRQKMNTLCVCVFFFLSLMSEFWPHKYICTYRFAMCKVFHGRRLYLLQLIFFSFFRSFLYQAITSSSRITTLNYK